MFHWPFFSHRNLAEEAERTLSDSKSTLLRKDGELRQVDSERLALADQVTALQLSARADKDEMARLK